MYLKQLDILGFKSFADKTRLTFEPGMIAIVGPNGCGKSNVSDAIRWVLGEQRPTALRCTKLVDVVFNGTDTRKPLGLCEVSITFADCEKLLGTEYDEVTVTRRVYRDGSGEYFINKTACRLKDVQRLFMGTGIGTTSYSVMAQGQIDQILSSKPEDRRAVFEEAAGITKFKADRKEALRKIEQTEQNLIREADILREMKRQIGSLQRQVGKAQKYKELRDEVRGLDIYVSRKRIREYDISLEDNARKRAETDGIIEENTKAVAEAESAAQGFHQAIHEVEEKLGGLATEATAADAAFRRAQEMIQVNAQRIAEYKSFSDRDGREIADAGKLLEETEMQLESLNQKAALLDGGVKRAKSELETAQKAFDESQKKIDGLRGALQAARMESAACDRKASETRDAIARFEYQAREALLKKDRLTAETAQLEAATAQSERNLTDARGRLETAGNKEKELSESAKTAGEALEKLRGEIADARERLGSMQTEAATKEAQLAMLKDETAAKAVMENVLQDDSGDVRIVVAETGKAGARIAEGERLVDHLALSEGDRETADRLLGDVVLVDGNGGNWKPSTAVESSSGKKSPITMAEREVAKLQREIGKLRETLATSGDRIKELSNAARAAEMAFSEARRAAAQVQGECTSLEREAAQLKTRRETVGAELKKVTEANADGDTKHAELKATLDATIAKRDKLLEDTAKKQDELADLETDSTAKSRTLTEKRVAASQMESELNFTSQQRKNTENRKAELLRTVEGRKQGIRGYEESIGRLTDETKKLTDSLEPLKEKSAGVAARTDATRKERDELTAKLAQADATTQEKRTALDAAREAKAGIEVAIAEGTMRRQNIYDRLNQEYSLDAQQVMREPDPEFKGGKVPEIEELEAKVNGIHAQIAELGPVNMVAIDEFRELEERYTKEKAQEADLLEAKEQIQQLITDLNGKSSDLFKTTFEKADENFRRMFTKLFNGGEAKLVLLENEEDPLECGIDIIARPPGKRPQSVTLLSGGERTMTAVALLFAIFRIKPAPFTMLDELDAALDDANIGRFVDALKEFLDRSQFLIITHNQHTIAGSDLVYGVSQQEKGISRIISMKLSDIGVKKAD